MMRRGKYIDQRAFTLVEVLIALGLSAALLASAFSFYFNLLNTRKRLVERADQQRAADVIIDQLAASLTTCIVGDQSNGAGVKGTAVALTIGSRSVAANLAERGAGDPAVFDDLQMTEIRFSEAGGIITINRWNPLGGEGARESAQTLTQRIGKLRFRYFNGSTWRDTFDSLNASALPIAVEVAIWFDTDGEENAENTGTNATAADDSSDAENSNAGGFDEFAFAMRDDRGFARERLPDRWRVFRVPDAADGVNDAGADRGVDASGGGS